MGWCAAQARLVSFADTADGVVEALTKAVVETALEEDLTDQVGMTDTRFGRAQRRQLS